MPFFAGANASAEDAPEELEEGSTSVNNLVHSMRLQSTQFDKKSYMTYLKVRARAGLFPSPTYSSIQSVRTSDQALTFN